MISCTMAWYETNLRFMEDILILNIVFNLLLRTAEKSFPRQLFIQIPL